VKGQQMPLLDIDFCTDLDDSNTIHIVTKTDRDVVATISRLDTENPFLNFHYVLSFNSMKKILACIPALRETVCPEELQPAQHVPMRALGQPCPYFKQKKS
jgi:hypothetical protein